MEGAALSARPLLVCGGGGGGDPLPFWYQDANLPVGLESVKGLVEDPNL